MFKGIREASRRVVLQISKEKNFFIRKGWPETSESVKRSKSYEDRRASSGSRNVETNGNSKGMAKHIWGKPIECLHTGGEEG